VEVDWLHSESSEIKLFADARCGCELNYLVFIYSNLDA
jgi:hypothetical protein